MDGSGGEEDEPEQDTTALASMGQLVAKKKKAKKKKPKKRKNLGGFNEFIKLDKVRGAEWQMLQALPVHRASCGRSDCKRSRAMHEFGIHHESSRNASHPAQRPENVCRQKGFLPAFSGLQRMLGEPEGPWLGPGNNLP